LVGHCLDWLVGEFYTHEAKPNFYEADDANDVATGAYVGNLDTFYFPQAFSEYAVFGDATFHATDHFDVQIGGREAWSRQTYQEIATGPDIYSLFHVPSPYIQPRQQANSNAFTFLVVPEYKFSPDLMVYARVASGYQVGGPNFSTSQGQPASYRPDTTRNYEIGIKGAVDDHLLSFDASLYYIDWRDIQLTVILPSVSYVTNGGRAKSEGVEFSGEAHPVRGLRISASGSYCDAVLQQRGQHTRPAGRLLFK